MAATDYVVWRLKEIGADRWLCHLNRTTRAFSDDRSKALRFVSETTAIAAAGRCGYRNVEAIAGVPDL